jgi:hypothetical protein
MCVRFASVKGFHPLIAQLAEQAALNRKVEGSTPSGWTTVQSWWIPWYTAFMARNSKIPPEELKEMLEELREHYGERVAPISEYCEAFETWVGVLEQNYRDALKAGGKKAAEAVHGAEIVPHFSQIRLLINKSYFLARLVYGGEKLRTEKCPIHKGEWSGQAMLMGDCPHQCDGSGFLRAKEEDGK